MECVGNEWWDANGETFTSAESPSELRDAVRSAGFALEEGRLATEWVDVLAEDSEDLADSFGLMLDDQPSGGVLLHGLLTADEDTNLHDVRVGGSTLLATHISFVTFNATDESVYALSLRKLTMVVTPRAIMRLWSPTANIGDKAASRDPALIGRGGRDTQSAFGTDEPFPSWIKRQGNPHPPDAVLYEAEAGAASILRATDALDDALLAWHHRLYASNALTTGYPSDVTDLSILSGSIQRLVREHVTSSSLLDALAQRLVGDGPTLPGALLAGPDNPPDRHQIVAHGMELVDQAGRRLASSREDLREAATLLASSATLAQARVQHEQAERTATFERRVSILAGVVAGPAVIASLAGANVDFWPLPSSGETLDRGAFPVLVFLALLVGLAIWRLLRPPHDAGG